MAGALRCVGLFFAAGRSSTKPCEQARALVQDAQRWRFFLDREHLGARAGALPIARACQFGSSLSLTESARALA
jgi:hypothetical protein